MNAWDDYNAAVYDRDELANWIAAEVAGGHEPGETNLANYRAAVAQVAAERVKLDARA